MMQKIVRWHNDHARRTTFAACLLLGSLLGFLPKPAQANGQLVRPGLPQDASGHTPGAPDSEDETQREMAKKLELRRNEERQKQLVKDTDRLLALATELKSEVDKTNKDVLSVEVIKKADEIEKLAKNVRERMKY